MPQPAELLSLWRRLEPLPGGRRLFSFLLGRAARYTGSIAPRVLELAPGHARVGLRDRPAVRNHLRSVHAVALMNLAEVASGLATISSLPPGARGILAGLSIEYLKKARGPLEAVCDATIEYTGERREVPVEAVIRDATGDVVARATARWLIGPETPKGAAKP
ncbi:MAG: DUF4442 domain-containing protein [Holophagales bacterium]|nr:MAG: DUF4442 domain-containing protein [Holophagales bacterium]